MADEQVTPRWMDMPTLCRYISMSPNGIHNWVAQGVIPPPRKRGGKLMWKWAEVDEKLTVGEVAGSSADQAERIRNATRQQAARRFGH